MQYVVHSFLEFKTATVSSWKPYMKTMLLSSPFSPRIQNLIFLHYLWQWNLSQNQNVTLSASTLRLLHRHSGSTPIQRREKKYSIIFSFRSFYIRSRGRRELTLYGRLSTRICWQTLQAFFRNGWQVAQIL